MSIALIWGARCRGFPSRPCSCARVTAAPITPTAAVPRVHRRADSTNAFGACETIAWRSKRRTTRLCKTRSRTRPMLGSIRSLRRKLPEENYDASTAPTWCLVRSATGSEREPAPDVAPPDSPGCRRADGLVVCVRQRIDDASAFADSHRDRPGTCVCALGGQGVRQSALSERGDAAWVVLAVAALLRRLRNDGDGAGAYDAGLPPGCVQVPARADLGAGRVPALVHVGNVFHRPDPALGSRRLLGPGRGRLDGGASSGSRSVDREA